MFAYVEVSLTVFNGAYYQENVHIMDQIFVLTLPSLAVSSFPQETADCGKLVTWAL